MIHPLYFNQDLSEGDIGLAARSEGEKYNRGQFDENVASEKSCSSLGPATEGLARRS
jgi:hypothetical protein